MCDLHTVQSYFYSQFIIFGYLAQQAIYLSAIFFSDPHRIANATAKKGLKKNMPRRRRVMSDSLKFELADELGVGEIARKEGFGEVTSRNCGNLVRKAIERAEKTVSPDNRQ